MKSIPNNQTLLIGILLSLFSFILFLIHIHLPSSLVFDENAYVPSAKSFIHLSTITNKEHPPLGKYLIALGIYIGGDTPFGWRWMSALFGSLTILGMFYLGYFLFHSPIAAFWVALITLSNNIHYVQSRIAMLDTFMVTFIVWSLVFFTQYWMKKNSKLQIKYAWILVGIFSGLGIATKWFAIIPWLLIVILIFYEHVINLFSNVKKTNYPHFLYFVLYIIFLPLIIYFLSYLPYFLTKNVSYTILDIIKLQNNMLHTQSTLNLKHPYQSQWYQWILNIRPIWYYFESFGTYDRAILLIGNPLVLSFGLIGLLFCLVEFIKNKSKQSFLILILYSSLIFSWILIPRKLLFYYYYYPAAMMLSLSCVYPFESIRNSTKIKSKILKNLGWIFTMACILFFIYFFPIISGVKTPSGYHSKLMWLKSWY